MDLLLGESRIYGETIGDADEEEKSILLDVLMNAIADVTKGKAVVASTKIRMKRFIRLANQYSARRNVVTMCSGLGEERQKSGK